MVIKENQKVLRSFSKWAEQLEEGTLTQTEARRAGVLCSALKIGPYGQLDYDYIAGGSIESLKQNGNSALLRLQIALVDELIERVGRIGQQEMLAGLLDGFSSLKRSDLARQLWSCSSDRIWREGWVDVLVQSTQIDTHSAGSLTLYKMCEDGYARFLSNKPFQELVINAWSNELSDWVIPKDPHAFGYGITPTAKMHWAFIARAPLELMESFILESKKIKNPAFALAALQEGTLRSSIVARHYQLQEAGLLKNKGKGRENRIIMSPSEGEQSETVKGLWREAFESYLSEALNSSNGDLRGAALCCFVNRLQSGLIPPWCDF